MNDERKTKKQLIAELEEVRREITGVIALERLRGQAQVMQSSEDIGPIVEALYRELTTLGLPIIQSTIRHYDFCYREGRVDHSGRWMCSGTGYC